MKLDTIIKINSDPNLKRYLHEHSYWYKILNRHPDMIDKMTEEMKKEYKLTFSDKIDDINGKMNLIKAFMDAIK
ncbi:MAG: YlbE-like family protein [Bacilli bacterium]|nr:YlbE-like family protein [Bacilli bacterium]